MAATRAKKSGSEVPSELLLPGVSEEEVASCLALNQILAPDGTLTCPEREVPQLKPEQLLEMYRATLLIRLADERLMALQRQGRIGFYGEARGQEAAVVGSA